MKVRPLWHTSGYSLSMDWLTWLTITKICKPSFVFSAITRFIGLFNGERLYLSAH
jgi:hypothetical protein